MILHKSIFCGIEDGLMRTTTYLKVSKYGIVENCPKMYENFLGRHYQEFVDSRKNILKVQQINSELIRILWSD